MVGVVSWIMAGWGYSLHAHVRHTLQLWNGSGMVWNGTGKIFTPGAATKSTSSSPEFRTRK